MSSAPPLSSGRRWGPSSRWPLSCLFCAPLFSSLRGCKDSTVRGHELAVAAARRAPLGKRRPWGHGGGRGGRSGGWEEQGADRGAAPDERPAPTAAWQAAAPLSAMPYAEQLTLKKANIEHMLKRLVRVRPRFLCNSRGRGQVSLRQPSTLLDVAAFGRNPSASSALTSRALRSTPRGVIFISVMFFVPTLAVQEGSQAVPAGQDPGISPLAQDSAHARFAL